MRLYAPLPLFMILCDVRCRYCFPVLSEVTAAPSLPLYRGHTGALQRHNTENSKQIFPQKELRDLSPICHFHVSVSDLYIPMIGLAILLQENMGIYKSLIET
jgi:hypothetical protein